MVRPRWWLLALTAAGCLGFTAIGVIEIASGELFGILAIGFFGGGALLVAVFVARRGLSQLTLTPAGIELAAGGLIPWEDIAAVGTVHFYTKLFGIRLKSYDRYLASVSPAQRVQMERAMLWFFKPFALVLRGFDKGNTMQSFASDVTSLESGLRWSREQTGWDVTFSPAWLDRPTEQFVTFVERYRRLVTGA